MYYEHGDVTLMKIDKIPGNTQKVLVKESIVLAEGETTGHAHRILDLSGAELRQGGGKIYLHLEEPKHLVHEEHGKLTISPGDYEIGRVKEYNPFEKEIHQVRD